MKIPNSSYRIQFNKEFSFRQFEKIIDYLEQLGIDTIYASPILGAVTGSTHGYDGTDLHRINPEIGTLDQFRKIKKRLQKKQIKWLQDIVPNHMAFHPENNWLMDILQYGSASRYHTYFDTVHNSDYMGAPKLMVPILGDTIDNVLKSGDISIVRMHHSLYLQYADQRLPLRPTSYLPLLQTLLPNTGEEYNEIEKQVKEIETSADNTLWEKLCRKVFDQLATTGMMSRLDQNLAQWSSDIDLLHKILSHQHYQLCYWQATDQRINYRRFFTVNGLICVNVHDPAVFKDTHSFIQKLTKEGLIDGLRVDHIDGLHDPTDYLQHLRQLCGTDTYIVIEKILEQQEILPTYWPVQGTTGYDFMALCQNIATDRQGYRKLLHYYEDEIHKTTGITREQQSKKQKILTEYMQGDLDNLVSLFQQLDLEGISIKEDGFKTILSHFLCYFPIYRLYDCVFPLPNESFQLLLSVLDAIANDQVIPAQDLADFKQLFCRAQEYEQVTFRKKMSIFLSRCMQFTGPLMAKGVEDTLMYTYNGFIAQNEVGNHPENTSIRPKEFHRLMRERQMHWPMALNASATHDTKRGEDTRSRLLVLASCAEEWIDQVYKWEALIKQNYTGVLPYANDRYALYQALYGAYPMPGTSTTGFEERLKAYLVKYLREGKIHSDWANPQETYETEVQHYADFLLNKKEAFFPLFNSFLQSTVDFGIINSLAQLILKFTCPGIPDIYQGTELWDFSFVDPDNRREVDYVQHGEYLDQIRTHIGPDLIATLWNKRHDGKIKLWLMQKLIEIRKQHTALGPEGQYIALKVKGKYSKHILAFARVQGDQYIVSAVPLYIAKLKHLWDNDITDIDWADTRIILPEQKAYTWKHLLIPRNGTGMELRAAEIFNHLPLAVISCRQHAHERKAGILLPITSLPSQYGIGDLGKPAFLFAHQLYRAQQRYWQILPWNPTSAAQQYSPYSTLSAMAGNPLLISLDTLQRKGLLRKKECKSAQIADSDRVDYTQVETIKMQLLDKAYTRAVLDNDHNFSQFCVEEAYWLDDYALFVTIRKQQQQPWYTWPIPLRSRNKKALSDFVTDHATDIQKEKWIQYTFFQQWRDLRQHAHSLGIGLLGDVPFYPSLDSADVWAHPSFFALKSNGLPRAIAGVPPDYFNADGQLWGMPVFDWQELKRKNYSWWIDRLRHHSRLFDKVRLDHFRAFAAFWTVPAEESSAKNGKWQPGPGADFFDKLQAALPHMPFIAEDLGDIDATVYQLRDRYGLAGMKVLQFAFGIDMPRSPHIPHQYTPQHVAYTGTHDNNTLLGWYEEELDQASRRRIARYIGVPITKYQLNEHFIKMIYASVAQLVIVPMQDILGLNASHRMNSPASTSNNWLWRMGPRAFDKKYQKKLKQITTLYNR